MKFMKISLIMIITFLVSCSPIPDDEWKEKESFYEDFEQNDNEWSTKDYSYKRYGGANVDDEDPTKYPSVQTDTVNNGSYAVRFGKIGHSEYSSFSMDIDLGIEYNLSFFYKISSEQNFDKLSLIIDGKEPADAVWEDSGEKHWNKHTEHLSRGKHTLTWMYHKNGGLTSFGDDTAWIDDIKIEPKYALHVSNIGNGGVIQRVNGGVSNSPYKVGTVVELEAVPVSGEHFRNWGGDFSSSSNKISVIVDKDKQIIARFTGETKDIEWLLMMYVGGDCDLEEKMWEDVNEMEQGLYELSTDLRKKVKVVVLWDGIPGYESNSPKETRLYELGPEKYENKTLSPKTKNFTSSGKWWVGEDANISNGDNVTGFLNWASENYPNCENYALILSDHGGGPRNKNNVQTKGAIWDETSNSGFLKTRELEGAINKAGFHGDNKLSMLGLDACFMASIEEAYEHRTVAKYFVASLQNEQVGGWEYNDWIPRMKLGMTPERLGTAIVKSYHDNFVVPGVHGKQTLSCTDLGRIEYLKENIDVLAKAIIGTGSPLSYRHHFDDPPYDYKETSFKGVWAYLYEIGAFAGRISSVSNDLVRRASKDLKEEMKKAIVYSWADYKSDDYYGPGDITGKGLSLMGKQHGNNKFNYNTTKFDFADGDWLALYNIWYP